MRILFLDPCGHLGGAERSLLDLMASFRAHTTMKDAELGLVAGGEGPLIEEAEALGVRVSRLPLTSRLASAGESALRTDGARMSALLDRRLLGAAIEIPEYARGLRAAIRRFAPTVIHSNGIKMHLLAAAVRGRAPLVWHVRDFIGERPLVRRAIRGLAWRADAAIAISNAVAVDVRRVMKNTPVSVVHNAIDTEVFAPTGPLADLDVLAGTDAAPANAVRVGLVATYARWKGHDVFLQAARRVASMAGMLPVRFYIVGGPIYDTAASQYGADELGGMVAELGLEPHVRFVPFQKRVDPIYRSLDVVVHASSRPEPFGRTIVEAMATGKPLIAATEGGAAELFSDGVDAVAVPARDPEALASAIRDLVSRPDVRRSIGDAARLTAVERFSRRRLADQVLNVYRTVTGDAVDHRD